MKVLLVSVFGLAVMVIPFSGNVEAAKLKEMKASAYINLNSAFSPLRFVDHRRHIFDLSWAHLPFNIGYSSNCDDLPKPPTLETMISVARTLSAGFPFVRVDLYSVQSRIIFGEMTWYPDARFLKFVPDSYDRKIGEALILPLKTDWIR